MPQRGVPSFKSAFETENAAFDIAAMLVVNGSTGRALWALTDLAGDLVVFGGDGLFLSRRSPGSSAARAYWSTPMVFGHALRAAGDHVAVVEPHTSIEQRHLCRAPGACEAIIGHRALLVP